MLSLKYLQENKEEAIKALSIKNFDASQIIDQVIELDEKKKTRLKPSWIILKLK